MFVPLCRSHAAGLAITLMFDFHQSLIDEKSTIRMGHIKNHASL
jgi:hypothetical protein